MNPIKALTVALLCVPLAACGDDGQATDGTPADSGSTSDVEATTTGSSPTSSTDPSTTDDPSTTSAGSATSDGDTTAGEGGDGSGSTGGGPTAGVCAATCENADDCCPLGALGCPSGDYPNNWSCEDGFCAFGGCSEDAECTDLLDPNSECHPISGIGTCFEPCREDGDCMMLLGADGTCTGMADDGTMYCEVAVDPCRTDDDCGGNGTCDVETGTCGCLVDEQCTDDGMACQL